MSNFLVTVLILFPVAMFELLSLPDSPLHRIATWLVLPVRRALPVLSLTLTRIILLFVALAVVMPGSYSSPLFSITLFQLLLFVGLATICGVLSYAAAFALANSFVLASIDVTTARSKALASSAAGLTLHELLMTVSNAVHGNSSGGDSSGVWYVMSSLVAGYCGDTSDLLESTRFKAMRRFFPRLFEAHSVRGLLLDLMLTLDIDGDGVVSDDDLARFYALDSGFAP